MSRRDSHVPLRDGLCGIRQFRRRENIAECADSPLGGAAHDCLLQRPQTRGMWLPDHDVTGRQEVFSSRSVVDHDVLRGGHLCCACVWRAQRRLQRCR